MKRHNFLAGGIITLSFGYLLVLNLLQDFQPPDDFMYAFVWEESVQNMSERVSGIEELFRSQWNHYFHQNPRFLSHSLIQILMNLPWWVFAFLNTCAFFLALHMLIEVLKQVYPEYSFDFKSYALVGLLFFTLHVDWGFSYGVLNGSLNYTWTLVYILYFIRLILELEKDKGMSYLKIVILSLIAGLCNEHVTLSVFLWIILMQLYKRKFDPKLSAVCLVLLTSGLILFVSPSRMGELDNIHGLGYRLAYFLKHFTIIILRYMPLLMLIVWLSWKHKINAFEWQMLGLTLVSNIVMIAAPIYQNRAGVFGFALLILVVLSLWIRTSHNNWKQRTLWMLLIYGAYVGYVRMASTLSYYDYWKQDQQAIRVAQEEGDEAFLDGIPLDHSSTSFIYNYKHDPNFFANVATANFYNLKSLKLTERYFVNPNMDLAPFFHHKNKIDLGHHECYIMEYETYDVLACPVDQCSNDAYMMVRPYSFWARCLFFIPNQYKIHFLKKHDLIHCYNRLDGQAFLFGQVPKNRMGQTHLIGFIDKSNFRIEPVSRVDF